MKSGTRKDDLTKAMIHEQDMEQYFQEDWNLGLSDLSKNLGLEERARQAVSKIPASARGRTPAEMGESVSRNYQANRGSLSNYHPEIKMIFDAASRPNQLRQRYAITLKKVYPVSAKRYRYDRRAFGGSGSGVV